MPTSRQRPATKARTSAARRQAAKPKGTWARLQAEAAKETAVEFEPYSIEDVDPPILIQPPDTNEQMFAMQELFDNEGAFQLADAKRVLQVICGDSFDEVWELVRRQKLPLLVALIKDISQHFVAQGAVEQVSDEDFPEGSQD